MAALTPPAPAGATLIYPPKEGAYYPTPVQGLSQWKLALPKFPPQAGLL